MSHRKVVGAIDVDQPPAKIVEEVLSSPLTRMPLWQEDPDNIVGVLHAKALLRAVQAVGNDLDKLDLRAVASAPWFIPDTTDLLSQLQAFRRRHEHFAIVVDEYRSEEHTSELQSLMRSSYAGFCLQNKNTQ